MRKSSSILLSMMVLTGSMMFGNVSVQAAVSEPTDNERLADTSVGERVISAHHQVSGGTYTENGVKITYSKDKKSVDVINLNPLETKIIAINVKGQNGAFNCYTSTDDLGASGLVAGHNMKTGKLDEIQQVDVVYEYTEYKFPAGDDLNNPRHNNHTVEGKDIQRAPIALTSGIDLTANGIKDTTFKQGATKKPGDTTWTDDVFEITVHRNDEYPELSTVDIKAIKEGFIIIAVDGTECWEVKEDGKGGGVTGLPVSQAYNVYYYYDEILKEDVPTPDDQKPETKPQAPEINWGQIGDLPITGVDVAVFAAVSAGLAGLGFTVRKMSKGNKNNDEE